MVHPFIAPTIAIIAGVAILIYPQFLNMVVAVYLIAVGVMGIIGAL